MSSALLAPQVSTASAGGCPADLDTISEELIRQLSNGQTVNVAGLLKSAAQSHAAGESHVMSRHLKWEHTGLDHALPIA